MMVQVLVVLSPFLAFAYVYNPYKVHNMLALILDMHFKSFDVMKTLVKWANVIQMVQNVMVGLWWTTSNGYFPIPKYYHWYAY